MEYTYHANGARATMTDQRGVVRAYTYDAWNRLTLDHATDLGAAGEGVDDLVRGVGTVYDQLGRTATITSYGDSNDNGILDVVRNQVQYGYDDYDATLNPAGWGGVARVWQEHDGAVNTGTSPSVQYGYDYDELSRLIATERGRLVFDDPNPGDVNLTDAVFGQDWELDGLGNWLAFDDDGAQQTRERDPLLMGPFVHRRPHRAALRRQCRRPVHRPDRRSERGAGLAVSSAPRTATGHPTASVAPVFAA